MPTTTAPPVHRAGAFAIRTATPDDVPVLRRIIEGAFRQYDTVLSPAVFQLYLADLLDVAERMDAGEVLVAERDGVPVGTVTFYPDGGDIEFGWPAGWSVFRALAVEPLRRGRGAGRALVTACVERAIASGAEVVGLHTATFMRAAVALYERCGFVRVPAHDIIVTDVFDVVDDGALPAVIAYRLGPEALRRATH